MDLPMDIASNHKAIANRLDTIRRRKKSLEASTDPEILSLVHDVEWLVGLVENSMLNAELGEPMVAEIIRD